MREEDLLGTIDAHPGDNNPRLVYADWLESDGRPAESKLIRADLQLRSAPGSIEALEALHQARLGVDADWLVRIEELSLLRCSLVEGATDARTLRQLRDASRARAAGEPLEEPLAETLAGMVERARLGEAPEVIWVLPLLLDALALLDRHPRHAELLRALSDCALLDLWLARVPPSKERQRTITALRRVQPQQRWGERPSASHARTLRMEARGEQIDARFLPLDVPAGYRVVAVLPASELKLMRQHSGVAVLFPEGSHLTGLHNELRSKPPLVQWNLTEAGVRTIFFEPGVSVPALFEGYTEGSLEVARLVRDWDPPEEPLRVSKLGGEPAFRKWIISGGLHGSLGACPQCKSGLRFVGQLEGDLCSEDVAVYVYVCVRECSVLIGSEY